MGEVLGIYRHRFQMAQRVNTQQMIRIILERRISDNEETRNLTQDSDEKEPCHALIRCPQGLAGTPLRKNIHLGPSDGSATLGRFSGRLSLMMYRGRDLTSW